MGDQGTTPIKSGFGSDLGEEGQGTSATKVPAIKKRSRPKRPAAPIDTDSDTMDAINKDAGFTPAPKRKAPRKASKKPKLPRIGPDPLNWTETDETGQISIPGPIEVFDRFKALRDHMQQPGWVIMNMLVAHFEHNPPEDYKQDSARD
mgnify:CR=1 FL=1